jgi:hypothetical protein
LYTVGGILDNVAAPSCAVAHKHKNRLFLAGLEDGSVWYSKEHVIGEGVSFNDGQRIQVDPYGGVVSALSTLDDKLILFKPAAIFYQIGDGPLDTGAQNDYTQPQLVSSDIGCENQKSLAVTPLGLIFQTPRKGIWLLDRGLGLRDIGAPIQDYDNLDITSAVVLEDENEVRFTTSDGEALVYNYEFDQWSTFTNYEAQSAINGLSSYLHLKSDGTVNKEIEDQYQDNGQRVAMRIETSWFSFNKIQGFQRIYRWSLLGDFISHCYARVKVAYDFEPVYNETVYFNTQTGLGTEEWGDDALWGDSSVWGGDNSGVFQFRSKPRRQKCQSIKLLIEDLDTVTDNGGGCFDLVSLAFEVGQRSGINRLRGSKTRGSL